MDKTTLYLPAEVRRAFRELAQQTGRPQAEIMREALDEYLEHHRADQPALCSVGVVAVPDVHGADAEDWLERHWHRSRSRSTHPRCPPFPIASIATMSKSSRHCAPIAGHT